MKEIKLTQGYITKVDDLDYRVVGNIKFYAVVVSGKPYAQTNINGKVVRLHQIILGKKSGYEIDHINGDSLDNRRSNLRFCTHAENMYNKKMYKNNKLGVKGVFLETNSGRYVAQVRKFGKRIVKRFSTILEAEKAYKLLSTSAFGEFSYRKSL